MNAPTEHKEGNDHFMALNQTRPAGPPLYVVGRGANNQVVIPDSDLQVRHIISVFRRGKGTILLCILSGLILAGLVSLLLPKEYAATAVIELTKSSSADPLGLQDLSGLGAELSSGEQMNSDLLTQLTVISSDTTALSVIEHLHLQDTKPFDISSKEKSDSPLAKERGKSLDEAPNHRTAALRAFQKNLKVEVVKGTRLISVTYRDADPVRAAKIANAVVDASIDIYNGERLEASTRASKWLTDQLATMKQGVDESQKNVEAYQQETGLAGLSMPSPVPGPDGASNVTFNNLPLQRLLELNRDLTSAEVMRTEKEAIYRMAQTQDPAVVLGIGSTSLSSNSVLAQGSQDLVLLQDLRQKEAVADTRLAIASSKYGLKNPTVVQLQAEVTSVKNQLSAELKRIQARSLNDLQLATKTEEGIRKQVAAQQEEVAKKGGSATKLLMLQQQALADRNLYQDLHSKLEEANMVSGIRGANISVVDVARIDPHPVAPLPARYLAIGLLSGAVVGTILAFVWSYWRSFMYEPEDIISILPQPVLGSIPDFRDSRSRFFSSWLPWSRESAESTATLLLSSDPQSSAAEAYRSLRTVLLQAPGGSPPRSILFISGSQGEGRSTTCWNTAAAFAAQGYRVLLVDADLRSRREGRYGLSSSGNGLSTYLSGGVSAASSIQPFSGFTNLSFLPAGPAVSNPSELLGESRFPALVASVLNDFDYVFFDCPPALTATDARVISQSVEGVVLVVRAGQTTTRELKKMSEWLRTAMRMPLGICLNAADV